MPQRSDNLARTETGYAAFAAADMNTLAELLAPDVEWVVAGDNALSGTYRGLDATFDFFGRLLRATEGTFSIALRSLAEPEPGLVVALVHATAQAHGVLLDEDWVQVLDVRAGQVARCRTFTQDNRRMDGLLGPRVIALPDAEQNGAAAAS